MLKEQDLVHQRSCEGKLKLHQDYELKCENHSLNEITTQKNVEVNYPFLPVNLNCNWNIAWFQENWRSKPQWQMIMLMLNKVTWNCFTHHFDKLSTDWTTQSNTLFMLLLQTNGQTTVVSVIVHIVGEKNWVGIFDLKFSKQYLGAAVTRDRRFYLV